jgi:site-specific recombinase XerD
MAVGDIRARVCCTGKGRKTHCIPLRKEVIAGIREWLNERNCQSDDPVFINARHQRLSRDRVQYIVGQHVKIAQAKCPALKRKRVSPHVPGHSTAMNLLRNGVDRSVIALWLWHESMDTTQIYLHFSMELKEKALAKTKPFERRSRRYRPPDQLLSLLQSL